MLLISAIVKLFRAFSTSMWPFIESNDLRTEKVNWFIVSLKNFSYFGWNCRKVLPNHHPAYISYRSKEYRSCLAFRMNPVIEKMERNATKDCLIIIRTLFLLTLFAVNFHAFNFELEEVWGHFWIALETSYSKMPSNFPWLKIKDMKIDSKNRQQN